MRPRGIALGLVAGITILDTLAKRHRPELTISQDTRVTCRTDTAPGRLAFLVGWGALAGWYAWHILDHPFSRGMVIVCPDVLPEWVLQEGQ